MASLHPKNPLWKPQSLLHCQNFHHTSLLQHPHQTMHYATLGVHSVMLQQFLPSPIVNGFALNWGKKISISSSFCTEKTSTKPQKGWQAYKWEAFSCYQGILFPVLHKCIQNGKWNLSPAGYFSTTLQCLEKCFHYIFTFHILHWSTQLVKNTWTGQKTQNFPRISCQ